MSIIYEAYNNLFTTKQRDNESLQEYTRRFKTATEVLETHTGGPIILEKLINKNMTDIKGLTDKEMMTRQVSDGFLAYLYLEQADKGKYGSILQGLTTQLSLGNDQFPKTMIEANSVLSNHRFDQNKNFYNNKKPTTNHRSTSGIESEIT